MEITLDRLRTLVAECQAITQTQGLGFVTDLKLQELGLLAEKRINYEKGFDELEANKAELVNKISQSLSDENINTAFRDSAEGKEILKRQRDLWDKKVSDFEPAPIRLVVDDNISSRVGSGRVEIIYKGFVHSVSPYMSLHELIKLGFFDLIENENS